MKKISLAFLILFVQCNLSYAQSGGGPFQASEYQATQDIKIGSFSIDGSPTEGLAFDPDNDGTDEIKMGINGGILFNDKSSSALATGLNTSVPNILFDTDFGNDSDDAAALAELFVLEQLGEANVIAITQNGSDAIGAHAIEASAIYRNRPNVPIGKYAGAGLNPPDNYATDMVATFPSTLDSTNAELDAVDVWRIALASYPDNSVTPVVVGGLRNLYELYHSAADDISPLTGVELLDRKVKELCIMAGDYPTGVGGYNITQDTTAATVITSISTNLPNLKVVYVGTTFGSSITTDISASAANSDVRAAFDFRSPGSTTRLSWDPLTVLYAVRGLSFGGETYFTQSSAGQNIVSATVNTFTVGPGNQYYLTAGEADAALEASLSAIVSTDRVIPYPRRLTMNLGAYFENTTDGLISYFHGTVATGGVGGFKVGRLSTQYWHFTGDGIDQVMYNVGSKPARIGNLGAATFSFVTDDTVRLSIAGDGVITMKKSITIDSNAANTVAIQTFENTAGDFQIFRTDATPESAVTGSIGDFAIDSTNGVFYFKQSGSATNTGWLEVVNVSTNYGEMFDSANTDAYVINAANDNHAYHTNGLATGNVNNWTFDAGGGGTSFPIASIADSPGSSGTQAEITTTGSHGLAAGAIVSLTNVSAGSNAGFHVVLAPITATTFEILTVDSTDATGTMDEAATLTAGTGAAGTYSVNWSLSATSATNNEIFDFQVCVGGVVEPGALVRKKFGTSGDIGAMSGTTILAIADGDKLSYGVSNVGASGNLTMRDLNVNLNRL